jgi:hypothetical protein
MMALSPIRFGALLLGLEIACTAIAIARAPRWDGFLIGDCPYYAATVESLVHDGDWDLSNQLSGDLHDHHGFFALSADNRVVPKHSVLLPILSVPFYVAFGVWGLLIFNLVQMFLLIAGLALLAGGGPAARLLALAGYLSTPFLAYTYNYSPDVLGTALLVWSYACALRNRPILSGLLAGLAVWAKIYLAIVMLPLVLILLRQGGRATLKSALAALAALLPMLAIQMHLFGSPFTTGYDRDARLTSDGFIVTEHYGRFNQPLLSGLGNLLFNRDIGLLWTAPLWFLWLVGAFIAWRGAKKGTGTISGSLPDFGIGNAPAKLSEMVPVPFFARLPVVALTLTLLFNLLFFARYDEWDASAFGNRFLFPALAIGLALQGPLWRGAIERWRTPRAPNQPSLSQK